MNKHNPVAKALASSKFKQRIVKAKKGKGSYTRKGSKCH
jgi:hypothetical protein